MTRRNAIAALSLAGVFLATYLTLYKLGYIGSLACGSGECERVQASRWATFAGAPVALWGVGFYVAMFGASVAGSFGPLVASRTMSVALVTLSGWGMLFTGWLTYLELVKIEAICRWCVGSAVLVVALFVLSVGDLKERRRTA